MVAPSTLPGRAFKRIDRISRLAFSWRANELSLKPFTGQTPTFARPSGGTAVDRLGVGRLLVHSQPRFDLVDRDGDGIREQALLLLEDLRTQLVPDPENFGNWTPQQSPTVTGGQADPFGGTNAYLITDDSGSLVEYIQQSVSFTGNGTKALLGFIKAGTAAITELDILSTGPITRVKIRATWSNGVPTMSISGGSGTARAIPWGDGWYLIEWTADGIVATDTNTYRFFPAGDVAANTGSTYFFGANAWNAAFPSSYQGPSLGTRNADNPNWSIDIVPGPTWIYARFRDVGTSLITGATSGVVHLGNGTALRMFDLNAIGNGFYRVTHGDSGSGYIEANLSVGPAFGDLVELVGLLYSDGHVKILQSLNEGAETSSVNTNTKALDEAWAGSPPKLWLNSRGGSGFGFSAFEAVKVGVGEIASVAAARAFPF